MQLILNIDDTQQETFLNIIQNLKEGMVKSYTLLKDKYDTNIPFLSDKEEQEILDTLQNMTQEERTISDTRIYTLES